MQFESATNISASLEHHSHPTLPAQAVECVFGSTRREALAALRTARVGQWDYTNDPVPQIRIQDERGSALVFQYSLTKTPNWTKTLQAVHLSSERGNLHMDGGCELAQRLLRRTTRQAAVLLRREARNCFEQLKMFVAGKLESESFYEHKYAHQHLGEERSSRRNDAFATIELPSGKLKINWYKHEFNLSMQERLESYNLSMQRFTAQLPPPHIKQVAFPVSDFVIPGCASSMSTATLIPPLPPFPEAHQVEEFISAQLSQPKLDKIANWLGAPPLQEHFHELRGVLSEHKKRVLFQALQRAASLQRAH